MAMIQAGMADVILAGGVEHMSGRRLHRSPDARWGCRLQDQVFVDAMIRALHCGSYVHAPWPRTAPSRTAPVVDMFKGKPYIMGAHGGVHRPDLQHQPRGDGRGGAQEPQQRRARHQGRRLQGGDRAHRDPPEEGQAARDLRQGRALPPGHHHGPDSGSPAAGLHPQDRQGHGGQLLGHQRRCGGHDHHVGGQGQGTGPQAPGPASRRVGRGACHPSVMGLSPVPAVQRPPEENPELKLDRLRAHRGQRGLCRPVPRRARRSSASTARSPT
ncbi:MAG: hypothetical protein MZU91_13560 [Desulfosudis oleivorans]|nr:hypothetical protein [Desulfosudis oleivorans]